MTTAVTLFRVLHYHQLKKDVHWHYNEKYDILTFYNGSQIIFGELCYKPTDPMNSSLGSLELTHAWVDESVEVKYSMIDTLRTRLGRRMNTEYGLKPKLLETFNPDKGHVYSRYYKLSKLGKLPAYRVFIPALPADNPYTTEDYKQQIFNSSPITIQRLWYGNFEYDDDPTCLIDFDAISNLFTNTAVRGKKYMTVDVARLGMDKTVVKLWDGFHVYKIEQWEKSTTVQTADRIKRIASEEQIGYSNIIIDEAGVGGGVVDMVSGCMGFIGGSSPAGDGNYQNLRAECYWKLAQMINAGQISIDCPDEATRQLIVQDLEQVRQKDPDKDRKLCLIPKEEIKQNLGRSPDFSDTLSMRMYPEVKPKQNNWAAVSF